MLGAFLLVAGGASAQAPTITTLAPARNALSAPRTTPVAVTFSQALSGGAATQGALRVFSQQAGGKKVGTVAVSGSTLTFTPGSEFKPGETVFATVTTGAQSSGNVALATPQVFQFTAATTPGPGTFGTGPDQPVGANPIGAVLGDVDGDGDLDLLTANYTASPGNTVSVRLNNGTGTFSGSQEVTVGFDPYSVTLGDVDGDGDLDLATANANSNPGTISIRLNNGSGSFAGGREVSVGPNPHAVTLGDVDGDGDLDLLAADYINSAGSTTSSAVSVRLNDGAGSFSGTQEVSVGTRPLTIAVGDVDSDGDLDFATSSSNGTTVSVRLNDGTGTFGGSQEVTVGSNPHTVAFGDLDADGDLDLVAANLDAVPTGTVSVRLNDGAGSFSGTQEVLVGKSPFSVVLGDVDGDGDLDLATANQATNTMSVRVNNGTGAFSGGQDVAVGTIPAGAALGDVDGNGTLDLVVANSGSNTVSVRPSLRPLATAAATLAGQVSVYPNPAHTAIRLLVPAQLAGQALEVSLLNALGQVVLAQHVAAQSAATLPISTLTQGVYLMRLHTADGVITKRVVVN